MTTQEEDIKNQRKAAKEEKRAEKLAKLQLKQQSAPQVSSKPKPKPKPTSEGYDPSEIELYWTKKWKDVEWFKATPSNNDKKFSICIPPPNITGSLHIGHAMMISIEDAIVRYKRLNGYEVLYLPGLDHAGIATQSVVLKNTGPLPRDEFLEAAHKWSAKYGHRIYEQFDRMGCSVDYSRKVFTLDPGVSKAVTKAFVELHKKGLIYRDNKIVNWSAKLKTTISDLEVNYKEVKGGSYIEVDGGSYKLGMMYYIKYYLTRNNPNDTNLPYVIVCTTRPETILGDTAICINPFDARFADIEEIFRRGEVPDIYNKNSILYELENKGECYNNENCKGCNVDSTNNTKINIDGNVEYGKIIDYNDNVTEGERINEEMKAEKKNKYKAIETKQDSKASVAREDLFAINPITGDLIPVIFDTQADLSFGTGILKVTPCHDPVDFQLGKKHNLKFVKIFDENNKIINSSKYNGIKRFDARKVIIDELKEKGYFIKAEEHDQILPFCSRSGDVIEPMIKAQWWMNCKGMARKAIDGVENGEIKIYPEEAKAVWNRWLENIRDWCLSRQLWWGHRVPAYRAVSTKDILEDMSQCSLNVRGSNINGKNSFSENCNETKLVGEKCKNNEDCCESEKLNTFNSTTDIKDNNEEEKWIVAESKEEALRIAKEMGFDDVLQDEDVLDTWFSSGLWPFSTMGWPEKTVDFTRYFPNSLLETGSDILFFWVARMVMLSYELCDSRPFDTILLHGIVRDSHGRKMSKSLGNVIDPLFVIDGISLESMVEGLKTGNLDQRELKRAADAIRKDYPQGIPKCGADALRFTLLSYTNGMKDINLDILRVQGYSRLCNKLFNAYKYVSSFKSNLNPNYEELVKTGDLLEHQKWILNRLNYTIHDQHKFVESYNFMMATQSIHSFFYEFCDYYIEISKANYPLDVEVLYYVFDSILKIFNPYMPFITEELHYKLFNNLISTYPTILERNLDSQFDKVLNLAKICRSKNVTVENFDGIEYLKILTKNNFKVVEALEEYEIIDGIKYFMN